MRLKVGAAALSIARANLARYSSASTFFFSSLATCVTDHQMVSCSSSYLLCINATNQHHNVQHIALVQQLNALQSEGAVFCPWTHAKGYARAKTCWLPRVSTCRLSFSLLFSHSSTKPEGRLAAAERQSLSFVSIAAIILVMSAESPLLKPRC